MTTNITSTHDLCWETRFIQTVESLEKNKSVWYCNSRDCCKGRIANSLKNKECWNCGLSVKSKTNRFATVSRRSKWLAKPLENS